jgi:hypothetical protein
VIYQIQYLKAILAKNGSGGGACCNGRIRVQTIRKTSALKF